MNKQTGLTIVELMIVLTVIAVISSLAYPSFQQTLRINRVQTQTTQMMGTLMMARSEAAKSNQPVVVCRSDDGASCATGSGHWTSGSLVFRDIDGTGTLSAGDEIVRVNDSVPDTVSIRALTTDFEDSLTYWPDGTVNGEITNIFRFCADNDASTARLIVLDATGRPRVDGSPGGACP